MIKKTFFSLITLIGFAILLWICILMIESRTELKWTQTKGHVIDSSLTIKHLSRFMNSNADPLRWYGVDVQYEYTVDGGLYLSNRLAIQEIKTRNAKTALNIMNKYRRNREVIVYYNPDDPLKTVIEPENIGDIAIPLLLAGLMVIIGLFVLYESSMEVKTRGRDSYLNQGNTYQQQGRYDEALNEYNKFIEITPTVVTGYVNRGNVYIDKGYWDLAIADFNKAISIDPINPLVYYSRGNAYLGNKQFDKAWADMQKAIELGFNVRPQILEKIKNGL